VKKLNHYKIGAAACALAIALIAPPVSAAHAQEGPEMTHDAYVQLAREAAKRGDFRGAAKFGGLAAEARFRASAQQQEERDRRNDNALYAMEQERAERERQWLERAKLEAEQRRQQEEADRAKQAIIDAKPINRLFRGYQYFGHVRFCNESRDGYLVQYVNDAEMEKAQRTIKDLVAQTTKEDPSIDTDDLWRKALNALKGAPSEQVQCQNSLIRLFKLAPTPVYSTEKP
jgi:hypothetical protein